MATASASSGAAVSALLQKASQQYLECRRKVSAKVDEVKTLEHEIGSLFATISKLGEGSAWVHAAKSVGRLELQITSVEGDAPVDDAVIAVEIDPEYEDAVIEVVAENEKKEEGEEAKEEKPAEQEEEKEEKPVDEEEKPVDEEEKPVDEEEKPVDEAAEKPVAMPRSVLWNNADDFPLSVVFDPVQSREAVAIITISPTAQDGEETEAVKEFRIPVASLFQTGQINRCYVIKKIEHVHVDKAALTEVADEDEPTPAATEETEKSAETAEEQKVKEEIAAEWPTPAEAETQKEEEAAASAESKAAEEQKLKDEIAAEWPTPAEAEVLKEEEAAASAEAETAPQDAKKKPETEEPAVEVPTAPHQTLVAAVATVESEDKVVVLKEGKLHVQVHFTMSEVEKLSQAAITLSQQKQEAEATLAVLEREAASLRTKYERLNASQRSLSAGGGGVVKPRSTLLGGRGLGAAPARVEKSAYQKAKDSIAAVLTPQRTQVITSFAIFCGSVALFHYQGDNLLA